MTIITLPGDNGNAYSASKHLYHAIRTPKSQAAESGGVIVLSADEDAVRQWLAKWSLPIGWTIGRFLTQRFTSQNGAPFDENSLCIEFAGISSAQLTQIATDLCMSFAQKAVLVKDYNSGNILFAEA